MKTFKIKSFIFLLATGFCFLATSAFSQQVADKIIVKVDNYIILKSELELSYQNYLEQSDQTPPPDAKCGILKQLLFNKVMYAKAEIDSITVLDEQVEAEATNRLSTMVQRAGGDEKKLEEYLGKSLADIKEELLEPIKEQLTIQKMRGEITADAKVTPSQVRKFYKNIPKDSIPFLPAEFEVAQMLVYAKVSKQEKERVRKQLLDIRTRIKAGEDFAKLAKEFSADLGSAAQGGNLGYRERGELVPEYEAMAFSLKPMEISEPVESEFGFHLIQLLERRGNLINTRHILIRPKPSKEDMVYTNQFVDSLRNLIVKDSLTFAKAVAEHSADRNSKNNGGRITSMQTGSPKLVAEDFDYNTYLILDTMKVGSVSPPLPFRSPDGKEAVRLLYFIDKSKPHQANLKDDYEKIYQAALNEERAKMLDEWFYTAIKELYIDIDEEYNTCGLLEGI
ncbi:peptidylprolyl isomerase [Bernardetia sp.]|uniref:peptidylprolyl isomerase n=1 Tax=Bernardetia sp. TaxID=1937974 RepID=UPI0025C506B6|nr:peptidylprolyl isomerase [Bernardetia sp.]